MSDDRWLLSSASEHARRLRAGELSSRELVRATLARIERLNPALRAAVSLRAEEAVREAEGADEAVRRGEPLGPLHGVPITLKDAFRAAGLTTTWGAPGYRRHRPRALRGVWPR